METCLFHHRLGHLEFQLPNSRKGGWLFLRRDALIPPRIASNLLRAYKRCPTTTGSSERYALEYLVDVYEMLYAS
jgi:hypothetical protein